MKDSRGTESVTLTFVSIGFAALTGKFLVGGMTLYSLGQMPVIGATEYGISGAGILAIWLKREWDEKIAKPKS